MAAILRCSPERALERGPSFFRLRIQAKKVLALRAEVNTFRWPSGGLQVDTFRWTPSGAQARHIALGVGAFFGFPSSSGCTYGLLKPLEGGLDRVRRLMTAANSLRRRQCPHVVLLVS